MGHKFYSLLNCIRNEKQRINTTHRFVISARFNVTHQRDLGVDHLPLVAVLADGGGGAAGDLG